MKAVKKYKKGGKVKKGSKKSTTPPKEIDLGPTIASKYRLSLKDAEEMTDRVQKNYGKHPSEIKTGYKGIDSRLSEIESNERQARARAGNKYYDGDGAGAARSEKAYADRLGRRVLAKMSAEKMKYKKGGKIVKYQGGGKIGPDQKKNKGRIMVQELPRNEQKKLGMPARDESYLEGRGKYEDFHNMNLYSATPEEALKYYKMDAAKKLLKKEGISAGATYSPEQVMSMARKKVDMNAVNKMAKTKFMDWSADRRKNPKAYAGSYRGVGGAQRLKK